MLETDRAAREAIEIGSFDRLVPIAIDRVAEVVGDDEEDV